jgi:hypothetical protein
MSKDEQGEAMSNEKIREASAAAASQPDLGRREFFKAGGAIGLASTLSAGLILPSLGGQAAAAAANPQGDFAMPKGLLPGAQSDSRFPVSFAIPVSQGLRLVIDYFTALNQRDVAGLAKTLHFPFAIYENIEPLVYESEADFVRSPPPSLNGTGKGKTRIAVGSYDLLESVNVHLYCPVGGVFSLSFARYTADGHKLLECDGLYSVTNNDGRWAIQLVSTIVHERGYEKYPYPDAEISERLGSQGYLAAFGYRDEALLNDRSKGRGSYEPRLPAGTKTASVSFGYGPRDRTRNARDNQPMKGWKVAGVKSRLVVSTVSDDAGEQNTNLKEFVELAGQTVGEYDYTRINPVQPLVIHATHDKAHVMTGYWRFTADSRLISETRGVGIRIRKAGHWGNGGGLGQVTHHDLSNSKRA